MVKENKMASIGQIVKGHYNEFTNREEKMSRAKMDICLACPLYTIGKFGPKCNPNMWVNPKDQQDFSHYAKKDFIKGCGCRLEAKTRLSRKDGGICPADFWKSVD